MGTSGHQQHTERFKMYRSMGDILSNPLCDDATRAAVLPLFAEHLRALSFDFFSRTTVGGGGRTGAAYALLIGDPTLEDIVLERIEAFASGPPASAPISLRLPIAPARWPDGDEGLARWERWERLLDPAARGDTPHQTPSSSAWARGLPPAPAWARPASRWLTVLPATPIWTLACDAYAAGKPALGDRLLARLHRHPDGQRCPSWATGLREIEACLHDPRAARALLDTLARESLDLPQDAARAGQHSGLTGLALALRLRPDRAGVVLAGAGEGTSSKNIAVQQARAAHQKVAQALSSAHARLKLHDQGWAWDPIGLLRADAPKRDKVALRLMGVVHDPAEDRRARQEAAQARRGRTKGPKGGTRRPTP